MKTSKNTQIDRKNPKMGHFKLQNLLSGVETPKNRRGPNDQIKKFGKKRKIYLVLIRGRHRTESRLLGKRPS